MRVLVTGGAGQLGTEVQRWFAACGDDVDAPGREQLDITDRRSITDALGTLRPDVIVNCAAWTAVDACEAEPERAFLVNGTAAGLVAEAAAAAGVRLIHVSTDYVFSGELDRAYTERDKTGPASVYGASKLDGEHRVLAAHSDATVVRTSWVCGEFGPNMVKTILRLLESPNPLRFVDDQRGSPTFTYDLAQMLRLLSIDAIPGLVHVTNQGETSWYGFAKAVLESAGADPERIEPIRTEDLVPTRPAPRPRNSVLDNDVLRSHGRPLLRDFHEPLHELVAALRT